MLDKGETGQKVGNGIEVIGTVDDLEKTLWEEVVDELIFAMPLKMIQKVDKYISTAEDMGVSVRIIPDWQIHKLMYRPGIASIRFEEFLGLPTIALTSTPPDQGELLIKSVFDYVFSAIALILSLPIFSFVGAGLKLVSPGPIFFKQERCGLNGRKFMVYKFRTMVQDAEARRNEVEALDETDGPVFKIKDDPRIIPFIGKLLRKVSLDELPQLINILKGEMSLVGPRPPIPAEIYEYSLRDRRRLSMKPGLTCLWQIMPNRNEISFEEWMEAGS
jgi:lipopolysaccharide/colanic/teichoic acid biosynthesis glycosyltransferase